MFSNSLYRDESFYDHIPEDDPDWPDDFEDEADAFLGDHQEDPNYHKERIPTFNGTDSWFAYEDQVQDWIDYTRAPPNKQGPLLKQRLTGLCETYKKLLDRTKLKNPEDGEGVKYLLEFLRPHFVKGSQNTFL